MSDKVSIIISTYNESKYLKVALNSVLKQTYDNWELIVIDDSSTDNTIEILQKYSKGNKKINVYKNKTNKGLIHNLNFGLKLSKGKYIARLDGDDIWLDKDKLSKQLHYLQKNKECLLVGSWGYKINEKGSYVAILQYPSKNSDIKNYILVENCFIHSSVMFNKEKALQAGGYDYHYKHAEDYALWLKMGTHGKFYIIPEITVGYRDNPHGITRENYAVQLTSTIKAVEKYKTDYPNYIVSVVLWNLRKFIPIKIRVYLSRQLRKSVSKFL